MESHGRGGRVTLHLILLILGAGAITAAAVYFFVCPCGNVPGGYLVGQEITDPIEDWSFANDVPLCQIQVQSWLPHSVNLNCMAAGGQLFLSCGSCQKKAWSDAAVTEPRARIRIGDRVYPVTLTRVLDPQLVERAWEARLAKLERPPNTPKMEGWWTFHVTSR